MTLEIIIGDVAEHAGEAALDIGFLLYIRRAQQVLADRRAFRAGHLLDADDEDEAAALGLDGLDALMDGGAARGAGILDPRRRGVAEIVIGLEREGGGEFLARKSGIAVADEDLVDLRRFEAGIGKGAARGLDDQRLDVVIFVLSERCVAPADDAGGHVRSP